MMISSQIEQAMMPMTSPAVDNPVGPYLRRDTTDSTSPTIAGISP